MVLMLRRQRFMTVLAALVMLALFVGLLVLSQATRPPRQIALFDSGVPGTPESTAALEYAHQAGFDEVINYSIINPTNPRDVDTYLDDADKLGIKVIASLKDLLGTQDMDPANMQQHQLYGPTTRDQVNRLVPSFDQYPAVWGFYIADELDGNAVDVASVLQNRQQQIKGLSLKPTLASFWRQPPDYLRTVRAGADHLMVDYYPFPEGPGQTYGPVSDIQTIAQDMRAVAGDNSWFALQAFSYYVSEPEMVTRYHFPAKAPGSNGGAPDTADMVNMAQLALAGGARNLAFFSYDYAKAVGPQQLDKLADAVKQIRNLPDFG